jgi:type I restriction enzyme S subunit
VTKVQKDVFDYPIDKLPKGWDSLSIKDSITKPVLTGKKVKQKDYIEEGALPVIDQGQKFIGGYTNETNTKVSCQLPAIVFGDHTRVVKYINFEFAPGADGIKVLQPNSMWNPKLLFYFIQAVPLPNKGYARHYQYLEKSKLPLPPYNEQSRIVAKIEELLTKLDKGVEVLERTQALLGRYRASVLKAAVEGRLVPTEAELARKEDRDYDPAEKLLEHILEERRAAWEGAELAKMARKGQAPKNDKWKSKYKEPAAPDTSDLPELPEGWVWVTLDQLSFLITSGSRGWAKYYAENGPIFIRAQDIKTDKLTLDTVAHVDIPKRVEGARTIVTQWDLLITITGANVTKSALVMDDIGEAYVSQHVGLVKPVIKYTFPFVYLAVVCPSYGRKALESLAYGAGKPGLNLNNLRQLTVPLPPLEEQNRIVEETIRRFQIIDEVESQRNLAARRTDKIRQAILQHAFEGKLIK